MQVVEILLPALSVLFFIAALLMLMRARRLGCDRKSEGVKKSCADFGDDSVWEMGKLRPIIDVKDAQEMKVSKRGFLKLAVWGIAGSVAGWLLARGAQVGWADDPSNVRHIRRRATNLQAEHNDSHYDDHTDGPLHIDTFHTDQMFYGPKFPVHVDNHGDNSGHLDTIHTDNHNDG